MEKKYLFIVFTKREKEENHRKGWRTVNLTRKRLINIKNSTKIRSLSKY